MDYIVIIYFYVTSSSQQLGKWNVMVSILILDVQNGTESLGNLPSLLQSCDLPHLYSHSNKPAPNISFSFLLKSIFPFWLPPLTYFKKRECGWLAPNVRARNENEGKEDHSTDLAFNVAHHHMAVHSW